MHSASESHSVVMSSALGGTTLPSVTGRRLSPSATRWPSVKANLPAVRERVWLSVGGGEASLVVTGQPPSTIRLVHYACHPPQGLGVPLDCRSADTEPSRPSLFGGPPSSHRSARRPNGPSIAALTPARQPCLTESAGATPSVGYRLFALLTKNDLTIRIQRQPEVPARDGLVVCSACR